MFRALPFSFLFGLLLVFSSAFSQTDLTKIEADSLHFPSCEDGRDLAKADIGKGIFKVYTFGFTIQSKSKEDFDAFYSSFMKRKYNVEFQHRGCVVFPDRKCYSEEVKIFLNQKYGADFFERSRAEAEVLFAKSDKKKSKSRTK